MYRPLKFSIEISWYEWYEIIQKKVQLLIPVCVVWENEKWARISSIWIVGPLFFSVRALLLTRYTDV